MAFKNQYVPLLEEQLSDFFQSARESLRQGYSKFDTWTVDYERNVVLVHEGSGHEIEDADFDSWACIDRHGHYVFSTERLSHSQPTLNEVTATYRLVHFFSSERYSVPDMTSLGLVKEALREYIRRHLFNLEAFECSRLTLIDGKTGKEI
jgi:hypothetical protein